MNLFWNKSCFPITTTDFFWQPGLGTVCWRGTSKPCFQASITPIDSFLFFPVCETPIILFIYRFEMKGLEKAAANRKHFIDLRRISISHLKFGHDFGWQIIKPVSSWWRADVSLNQFLIVFHLNNNFHFECFWPLTTTLTSQLVYSSAVSVRPMIIPCQIFLQA